MQSVHNETSVSRKGTVYRELFRPRPCVRGLKLESADEVRRAHALGDLTKEPVWQENLLGRWMRRYLNRPGGPGFDGRGMSDYGFWALCTVGPNIATTVGKAAMSWRNSKDYSLGPPNDEKPFNYIALGTGGTTPVIGDTALETEITTDPGGLNRALATISRLDGTAGTNTKTRLVKSFTAGGSFSVQESGILNGTDASTEPGVLAARETDTVIPATASDIIIYTWDIDNQ